MSSWWDWRNMLRPSTLLEITVQYLIIASQQNQVTFHVFGLRETMHCLRAAVSPFTASPSSTGSEKDQKIQYVPLNRIVFRLDVYSQQKKQKCRALLPIQGSLSLSRYNRANPSCNTNDTIMPRAVSRGWEHPNDADPSSHCSPWRGRTCGKCSRPSEKKT